MLCRIICSVSCCIIPSVLISIIPFTIPHTLLITLPPITITTAPYKLHRIVPKPVHSLQGDLHDTLFGFFIRGTILARHFGLLFQRERRQGKKRQLLPISQSLMHHVERKRMLGDFFVGREGALRAGQKHHHRGTSLAEGGEKIQVRCREVRERLQTEDERAGGRRVCAVEQRFRDTHNGLARKRLQVVMEERGAQSTSQSKSAVCHANSKAERA